MKQILRVSDPRELLALVPYQLGFQPKKSTVVLSLRGDRMRVGVIARSDTADLTSNHARYLADGVMQCIQRDGATGYVIAVYEDEHPGDCGLLEIQTALENLVIAAGRDPQLVAVWVVTPTHFIAPLDCADVVTELLLNQDRIDWEYPGRTIKELDSTVVSATMVMEGVTVAPVRELVADIPEVSPVQRRAAARSEDAELALRDQREGGSGYGSVGDGEAGDGEAGDSEVEGDFAAWDAAAHDRWVTVLQHLDLASDSDDQRDGAKRLISTLTVKQLGRMGAGLRVPQSRDAILSTIVFWLAGEPSRPSVGGSGGNGNKSPATAAMEIVLNPSHALPPIPERIRLITPVLELVVGHQRKKHRADGFAVLALVAWWSGSGARARIIAEEALQGDKSHRLNALLCQLLDAAIPPGWVSAGRAKWSVPV